MNSTPSATTTQSLGSLLKSARDIMRKDKGRNGDRLPLQVGPALRLPLSLSKGRRPPTHPLFPSARSA